MQSAIYNAYFGFAENPFEISPDPEFLYRSPQHEEALANLIYGVRGRKGFIVLTGEVGTGKTTLLECLRDYLESQRIEFAFIFNSRLTPEQFFEMMAFDFDLQCDRKSKPEVLFALNALLLQQAERGRTTALIVDEAHNLDWEVLEEIRLLGNLENRHGKLLQIILAGPAGARPQAGRLQSSPVETAYCAPLCTRSAFAGRSDCLYRNATSPGRYAKPDGVPARRHGRDLCPIARYSAPDQPALRQSAHHRLCYGAEDGDSPDAR